MTDWVTRDIEATGGAVARKLQRLRDAADRSQHGSPAQLEYGKLHQAWACDDIDTRQPHFQREAEERRERLRLEAEAEEATERLAEPQKAQ